MTTNLPEPLSGPPPAEVHLPNAPLVRVLAQVRFPQILAIRDPDTVAKFQEEIRNVYPVLEKDELQNIALLPTGQAAARNDIIWRFYDGSREWRISLGTGFVALETQRYTNRQDFLVRLHAVLASVEQTLDPKICLRLGIRYIDRVEDSVDRIGSLVQPFALGIAGEAIGHVAQHVLTEAIFPTEEGGAILARWGRLPPNGTIDPDALEPIAMSSWILDLDMSSGVQQPFSAVPLSEMATQFTQRIYAVFRWMVTDDFLRAYGGAP